ncbi:MAG: hypothetical protein ACYDHM_15890 [Acidiferrobacterales bacterium]
MLFSKERFTRSARGSAILAATALAGCATTPQYGQMFAGKPALGNVHIYAASRRDTHTAVLNALATRDFQVKGEKGGIITAVNDYKTHAGSDKTYQITARIYVQKIAPEKTQVSLTAAQKTVVYQEWHTWWHLLWIVPIFPTGTQYKTTTADSGAITNKTFYSGFFSDVAQQIKPKLDAKVAKSQTLDAAVKQPAAASPSTGLKSTSLPTGANSPLTTAQ